MKRTKAQMVSLSVLIGIVIVLAAVKWFLVPDGTLQPWHRPTILQEPPGHTDGATIYADFKAEHYRQFLRNHQDFSDYLAVESQQIRDIYATVRTEDGASRYHDEPHTGNFSFELQPDEITAGVLLVHGLSDSPHHIRALAETFKNQGCYVIGLRLPGHGSVPAALLDVDRKDWSAAVEFGAAMVQRKLSSVAGRPKFYAGGFSTGGALTLRYTLNSLTRTKGLTGAQFRKPDKLFLFSPAIAVTRKAILANWHKAISWLPGYEKLKWDDLIELEDDVCKYNSFPKNAGDQIHLLTKDNGKLVADLKEAGKLRDMPPVFAFQSTVDATVKTQALVKLFTELPNEQSELFLFDINRSTENLEFVISEKQALSHTSYELSMINFRYTFITNRERGGPQVFAYSWQPGTQVNEPLKTATAVVALDATWPDKIAALSHVSMPISPQDTLYGETSPYALLPDDQHLLGEYELLTKAVELVRLRYNPFFAHVEQIIRRELGVPQDSRAATK